MQPNHKITRTNLCVDRLTIGIAMNAARGEAKCLNKKIMSSCYVLVHEDWNDSLDRGHVCLPFAASFKAQGLRSGPAKREGVVHKSRVRSPEILGRGNRLNLDKPFPVEYPSDNHGGCGTMAAKKLQANFTVHEPILPVGKKRCYFD